MNRSVSVFVDAIGTRGKTVCRRVAVDGPDGLKEALEGIPRRGAEWSPWWSPHVFGGNIRKGAGWQESSVVVYDIDHEPGGRHSPVSARVRDAVEACPPDFATAWHFTPRGMRICLLLEEPCRDRDAYAAACRGGVSMVSSWLDRAGVSDSLANDEKVYKDFGRLLFPPSGEIVGREGGVDIRDERVNVNDVEYQAEKLGLFAAPEPIRAPAFRPVPVRQSPQSGDDGFMAALKAYNMAHARDWGSPGSGRCPFHPESGSACFGRLPGSDGLWCCFSSHHPDGAGHESGVVHVGDAADLDAFERGISVFELVMGRRPGEDGTGMSHAEMMEGVSEWRKEYRSAPSEERHAVRPSFLKQAGEEVAAISFAEELLDSAGVYRRGGVCVRVIDGEMVQVRQPDVAVMLGEGADWMLMTKDGPKPWDPTDAFCSRVLGRTVFGHIRQIDGIAKSPLVLPDGTFLSREGYDEGTRLYLNAGPGWPSMPSATSADEAKAHLGRLLDLVRDFPFESERDRSAWLAGLLTPLCRMLYHGNTPMFVFTATTPGSGKTLLAQVISIIVNGEEQPVSQLGSDAGEQQKEMLSILLAGRATHLMDNVSGDFRSQVLESVLTGGGSYTGRILGQSRSATVPVGTVFYLTGNNVSLGGDLFRRVILCHLAPQTDSPESRGGFSHPDLTGYAKAHRRELYTSAACIVQGWIQAGMPAAKKCEFGSFKPWGIVRDVLMWAGMPDPFGGPAIGADAAEDRSIHDLLLTGIEEAMDGPFTAYGLCSKVNEVLSVYGEDSIPARMQDLVGALRMSGKMDQTGMHCDARRVSRWFREIRGRYVRGRKLEHATVTAHGGRILWSVQGVPDNGA